jgi:AraC family transcriptional regulator of adaptative response/methylated-DNA-[protein]-cysteine methyltransferase
MPSAFLASDAGYDGVFITAVRTTGIYCLPSCSARKPLTKNIEFFPTSRDATFAGYRPCKRCRPLETPKPTPDWLAPLLAEVDEQPSQRWRDSDLRESGLASERVRRWFVAHHGMTFHAYQRGRRLGRALTHLSRGDAPLATGMVAGWESASGFASALMQLAGRSPGRSRQTTIVHVERIASPLGPLIAGATDEGVCLLEFAERRMLERQLNTLQRRLDAVLVPGRHEHLRRLAEQLTEYFAGARRTFDLPLVTPGTDWQRQVWQELLGIPYGETTSYGALARRLGRPTAPRAVARANGDNRIAIVIPCHRVIAADGSLSGYGGGKWRKRRMLELESGSA